MKLKKPEFWQENNSLISILLFPITFFLLILIFIKKIITKEKKFNIPILCIGNIYIGGTGKTPLSIFITNELKSNGKNPVIIRKFYKNHRDEHLLIKKKTNSLILDKSRINAIKMAERQFDLAILDDGFQDYKIKKNLCILCFATQQLIGNGQVFPSGPLREGLGSVKKAQIAVINGAKNEKFEERILKINSKIDFFYTKYFLKDFEKFKNKKIFAFAGIGNPENFFNLLNENNLNVKKTHAFPDHYEFNQKDIIKIIQESKKNNYTILTTEKDYLRLQKYNFSEIDYCAIELKIVEKDRLINKIKKLYD